MDRADRKKFFHGQIFRDPEKVVEHPEFVKAIDDAYTRIKSVKKVKPAKQEGLPFHRWLRNAMKESGVALNDLSVKTGIKECYVRGFMLNRRSPTLVQFGLIAKQFDISGYDLMVKLEDMQNGEKK